MMLNAVTGLVALLLIQTPFLWPHTAAQTAITVIASAIAAVCSAASCLDRRWRPGVAVAGLLLALTAFAFTDEVVVVAVQLTTGFLFFVTGIAPEVRRIVPAAARAPEPIHQELRRAA